MIRYTGQDPEPRPGLSSGHMPHSMSLPFSDLVESKTGGSFTTLREPSELLAIVEGALGSQENISAVFTRKESPSSQQLWEWYDSRGPLVSSARTWGKQCNLRRGRLFGLKSRAPRHSRIIYSHGQDTLCEKGVVLSSLENCR